MENKKIILDFMKQNELMVLSTINKSGNPESAVVGYTETPSMEIIFGTFNTTRKYANLRKDPHVSIVIGWDLDKKITIQYEGVAKEITEKEELELCRKLHIAKNPKREKHTYEPAERMFKVKPHWIRYSDLKKDNVFELTL